MTTTRSGVVRPALRAARRVGYKMRRGFKVDLTKWSDWDDLALLVHALTHQQEGRRREKEENPGEVPPTRPPGLAVEIDELFEAEVLAAGPAVQDPYMIEEGPLAAPTGLRAAAAEFVLHGWPYVVLHFDTERVLEQRSGEQVMFWPQRYGDRAEAA